MSYDLFDGGKKRSTVQEREAQLAEAKENLASASDEVSVRVQAAYNNLDRAQQMVVVSQELVSLRQEARAEATQQAEHGELLQSQAQSAVAQEFDARTSLLQWQLE